MPGVPKSRGCDACRKQKKKCDAATGTACGRCRRLDIPCVGSGQQRYKFQDEGLKLALRNKSSHSSSSTSSQSIITTSSDRQSHNIPSSPVVLHQPTNALDKLTISFIDSLSPSLDISIQLLGNFGGFLAYIPSRLGRNAALDTAADVLVAAYTRYRSHGCNPTNEILIKHSRALNALRKCLGDPVQATSSETLGAVMVLLLCQVFMGKRATPWMSHSVGAAQILKSRGYSGPKDDFEEILLLALRGSIVLEAFSDSRIRFTSEEWKNIVFSNLDKGSLDGRFMVCLGKLPQLMQRGRLALKHATRLAGEVREIRREVAALHQSFLPILEEFRERYRNLDTKIMSNDTFTTGQKRQIHCHCARMLGFGLAIGIAFNCILSTLSPDNTMDFLRQDNESMVVEILELEGALAAYRPLGALMVLLSLGAAYVGTTDPHTRARIVALGSDYQRDIDGSGCGLEGEGLEWYQKQFTLV